jgi:hypothetical protein
VALGLVGIISTPETVEFAHHFKWNIYNLQENFSQHKDNYDFSVVSSFFLTSNLYWACLDSIAVKKEAVHFVFLFSAAEGSSINMSFQVISDYQVE